MLVENEKRIDAKVWKACPHFRKMVCFTEWYVVHYPFSDYNARMRQ